MISTLTDNLRLGELARKIRLGLLPISILMAVSSSPAAENPRNLYDVLELPRTASIAKIKEKARTLFKKYHPDWNRGDRSSEGRFREVVEAKDILTDPPKKRAYDERLNRQLGSVPEVPHGGLASPNKGKTFDSLEDLLGFVHPRLNDGTAYEGVEQLENTPRGTIAEMSPIMKDRLRVGILGQLSQSTEEFDLFDVTYKWLEWMEQRSQTKWVKPKFYFGLEDFALYESAFRGLILWSQEIQKYSAERALYLLQYVRQRIESKIEIVTKDLKITLPPPSPSESEQLQGVRAGLAAKQAQVESLKRILIFANETYAQMEVYEPAMASPHEKPKRLRAPLSKIGSANQCSIILTGSTNGSSIDLTPDH